MKSQTLLLALLIGICAQGYRGQVDYRPSMDSTNVKDCSISAEVDAKTDAFLPETVGVAARFNLKPVGVKKNVSVKGGKGDLPIFNLYGPVKSCIYEEENNEDEYYHREFSRNGRLLSENGDAISEMYPKGLRRNKAGRIVYGNRGFGEIYYKYDKNGLLTKIVWVDTADGMRYESISKLFYDKRGLMVRMECETGGFPPINFTILETDKYGNWTKRKDSDGCISIQTITYYK